MGRALTTASFEVENHMEKYKNLLNYYTVEQVAKMLLCYGESAVSYAANAVEFALSKEKQKRELHELTQEQVKKMSQNTRKVLEEFPFPSELKECPVCGSSLVVVGEASIITTTDHDGNTVCAVSVAVYCPDCGYPEDCCLEAL